MKRYRITTWQAIAFGILATTLAGLGFWQMAHQIRGTLLIVCPGFALTVLLWLGSDGTIEGLAEWVHARPARIAVAPAGLWLLYMAYAAGGGPAGVRPALTMAAYLAVPFLAMSFTARAEPLVIMAVAAPGAWSHSQRFNHEHNRSGFALRIGATSGARCWGHCLCRLEQNAGDWVSF